jgi:tetratricopeptide (TPR) repeat protein
MQQIAAAIALDPTDTRALVVVSSYFAASGDLKKARCVGDRILSVDPLSDDARIRGYWYIEATDAKEALRQSEYALAAPETVLAGHDIRGLAFILEDNFEAADREADAALALSPRHYIGKSLKAMVAAGRGHRTEAEAWLATFEDDAKRNHFSAMRVALCRARLGDRDAALTWIERAETLGHKRWYSLTRHPWLEPLRAEPRFEACLRRIKNDLDAARPEAMQAYSLACVPPREPFPRHNDADQRRSSQRRGAFHPLDGGDVVVSSCVPWQARGPRHA